MNLAKPPTRTARVTIRTVAADAGVSVAAVSKVLRDAYGVSDTLRQNVQESIDRLGYRPNVAARSMRGQTYTIGVLLVELGNPFLPQIVSGVNEVLSPSNYQAIIGVGQAAEAIETPLIDSMIDYRMDGLILVAPQLAPEVVDRFAAQLPIVVIGHHAPFAQGYDTVNADDNAGARIAVQALVERGHDDIMMISLTLGSDRAHSVVRQREIGYLSAMAEAGLPHRSRIIHVPDEPAARDAQLHAILAAPDRPTALFCWSDLVAIHVLSVARQLGLTVPRDLAVIGYDNNNVAALPLVDLASIDQSGRKLGETAARMLLTRIGGRDGAHHILLNPHLVARGSLGSHRA